MSSPLTTREVPIEAFSANVANAVGAGRRFAGLFAVPEQESVRLLAILATEDGLYEIGTRVSPGASSYPSLSRRVPGADWYEREIHDEYRIQPVGHPDLDPLVLPLAPETLEPRPGSGRTTPRFVPSAAPLARLVHGAGLFTMSYGPVRSGVFEAIEYVVETPGEGIPRVRTRPHYKHRGVEVSFERRSAADGVLVAERVEGVASVAHAIAYCDALERVAEAEVPPGGALVRAFHAELERIANHLDSTIRHTEAAGQAVAFARLSLHKERLMRLRGQLSGSRFGRGVVALGGVNGPLQMVPGALRRTVETLERGIRTDLDLLMTTPSFLDRLRGTGVLPHQLVVDHGGLGPLGRGSGLGEDVRHSRPYGAYRHLELTPSSRTEGDALARQRVRNEEIATSFHLLEQVIDALDELGETTWSVSVDLDTGEAIGWAEAPQGEVLYFVRVEKGMPTRVKPRSASFHNLGLFTAAFPKDITTDFAFIEASFGLSVAGVAG